MNPEHSEHIEIPVLPLHDAVTYPHMIIPLFIRREKPIRCLGVTMNRDKKIMLVTQKEASTDEPDADDPFTTGAVVSILQMLKLPDGTVKVLAKGLQCVHISAFSDNGEYFSAKAEYLELPTVDEREQEVLVYTTTSQPESYIKLNKRIPPEVLTPLNDIDDPTCLTGTIVVYMSLKLADKQSVLEMSDVSKCLEYLMAMTESEIDLLQVKKYIRNCARKQMEKPQREYYLNGRVKVIQKESGEMDDAPDENKALERKIDAAKIPKEVKEKVEAELRKLKMMSPMSAETTVVRGYIDWMIQVPRDARSEVKRDLRQAQEILNTDYYGLGRVEDCILEYLAVQNRVSRIKGPILCLIGPPGVDKTFLGQSIIKATGRKYVRMTLGGVRGEAEIRGHRRTYTDSIPGKLIQKMVKVGVKNPLFLLDEIDKVSSNMRGDPVPALPEVLDPEQNVAFSNRYLGVGYNPGGVMPVATPNSMDIPVPLLDRMEVIHLPGYTENEKLSIAERHLLPKQIECSALKRGELTVDGSAIIGITRYYTREVGVCGLEREISKLCRKAVKQLLLDKSLKHIEINGGNLYDYLDVQRFDCGYADGENRVDQVTGLAWAEVGGDLLTVEIACIPGKGKLTYTGPFGGVMQEPTQVVSTVARAHAEKLGINPDFYEKRSIHIRVPEGAVSKDGSSAGIAMCTALVSYLTSNPVRADVTVTGEIALHGQVLPTGGLEERLLAVHRGGIRIVLIPSENKCDLGEVPDGIIAGPDIHPVRRTEEVLTLALQNEPFGMQVVTVKQ